MSEQDIYNMDLHETIELGADDSVFRVHSGWIYRHREILPAQTGRLMKFYSVSQVFVPWTGKV